MMRYILAVPAFLILLTADSATAQMPNAGASSRPRARASIERR